MFIASLDKLNTDFRLAYHLTAALRSESNATHRSGTMRLWPSGNAGKQRRQAYECLYNSLLDEYARLDKNRRDYNWESPDTAPHPLFVEALQKISLSRIPP